MAKSVYVMELAQIFILQVTLVKFTDPWFQWKERIMASNINSRILTLSNARYEVGSAPSSFVKDICWNRSVCSL